MYVFPAMVAVPVREDVPVLAATFRETVPFPEPEAPEPMVIQELLLTVVQAQPVVPVTDTETAPPLEPTDWLVGEML